MQGGQTIKITAITEMSGIATAIKGLHTNRSDANSDANADADADADADEEGEAREGANWARTKN